MPTIHTAVIAEMIVCYGEHHEPEKRVLGSRRVVAGGVPSPTWLLCHGSIIALGAV